MVLFTNVKTKRQIYRIQMHILKYPLMTFSITVISKYQIKKFFFPEKLEIEPRVSWMIGKHSTHER